MRPFSSSRSYRKSVWYKKYFRVATVLFPLLFIMMPVHSYPVLDQVAGLPFPELVTVYPDDVNPNLYYFVPTTVALAVDPQSGKPRLGVQYWGLTALDPAGKGASLTFSVKPSYDKKTVDAVADGLKKVNPNAMFAFPTLVDSSMDIIINGAFVQRSQDTSKPTVKGGTVDATQAFTIGLTDIGARAFAQGVAADSDLVAARYTYKFTGVAKRLHARITVYDKRVYDHFKARASASAWWGMVRTSWAADWQKLTTDGSIKVDILEGGETDNEAYILEVFKILVSAKIGETGMFAPKLKPSGIDVESSGSSHFGWGFSGGGAWEHLEESHNFVFEINKQKLEDREFSAALSFSAVCAKYPDSFADLTLNGKKCIDKTAFAEIQKAEQACVQEKLEFLNGLLQKKLITQQQYDERVTKILDGSCYSTSHAIWTAPSKGLLRISPSTLTLRQACTTSRLAVLKKDLASGTIAAEAWAGVQSKALDMPCSASTPSDDLILQSIRESNLRRQPIK